ncbi:MAG TPA: phosphate propanoyltransferase [Desulfobacteria bacterium]|nr:phosphate propanoyltransferase [Desulfobacteria bacterium]
MTVENKKVPVGISNRHIHLTTADIATLFGSGASLTHKKDLGQPGQFAAEEVVTLVGPKGKLEGVRVLGPARSKSQVEVSQTDAFKLGIKPPVRDSGKLDGTPGMEIIGPAGKLTLAEGVIIAARHIHMHTTEAEAFGLKDQDRVKVVVPGERGLVFDNVLIRSGATHKLEFHVDTDEANACMLANGVEVNIIK